MIEICAGGASQQASGRILKLDADAMEALTKEERACGVFKVIYCITLLQQSRQSATIVVTVVSRPNQYNAQE